MTFVIGSIQLTVTRIPPKTADECLRREMERRRLEREIAEVRQRAHLLRVMNGFGIGSR